MTLEQLFLAAIDLPDAAARAAYLEEASGGDAELRRQVEGLLASHDRSGEFLDRPAAEQIGTTAETAVTVVLQENAMPAEKSPTGDSDDQSDVLHFLAPSTRPDSLGRIGHYEVLEVLGKGGFGTVLRAFDDVLQRVVAIKVLAPELAVTSPARKRFLREAQSSAKVRHENVVQVYETQEKPLPYLVMEFIPGETLQQRLDRCGPLDTTEIVQLGRQIAAGLAAAHDTGLIHRDVKPGNILIEAGPSERVKLTDFGLARAADDASMTQSGVVAGTPTFMAPEQARGETLDHRADLFSLGSVLYTMCTGRPPFRAATTFAVLKRVVEDDPRPIREVIPETPEWLCGIVAKLHAKDPAARFQTAREVAELLTDCEAKLKAQREIGDIVPVATIASAQPGPPSSDPELRPLMVPTGIRWPLLAATGIMFLLCAILLAVTESTGLTHLFRGPLAPPSPVRPGPDSEGWVQLFNGQNLSGWKAPPEAPGHWQVKEGVLAGSRLRSGLFTERGDYANFHLRLEAKVNLGGDSGILFRHDAGMLSDGGYEAEIRKTLAYGRKTGTVQAPQANGPPLVLGLSADDSLTQPDEWFTLEIIADHNRFITKVNGKETAHCVDSNNPRLRGHIGLQVWNANTLVQFRKIEIKELPPSASSSIGTPSLAADVLRDATLVMDFEKDSFYEKDGKTYIRDHSGRGNDGVCEGVSYTPNGKVGGGLACEGEGLRIPSSLIHGQANYSITGWCRWDQIAPPGQHELFLSATANKREPLFIIGVPPERSVHVSAWNKDHAPPQNWLVVHTNVEAVPYQKLYFFAVTMRDGGVGKGELRVTIDDTTYALNTQMCKTLDGLEVYDLIGYRMSGAMIDEVTVFKRALADSEIRALRELAQNNVPLSRAKAGSPPGGLAKRRFVTDEWIDVIPLIDPALDKWNVPNGTGKNAWRKERDELVVDSDALGSKLLLPLDSEWQAFEYELAFTRRAGTGALLVNLPTKIGDCPVVFNEFGSWLGSRARGAVLKEEPRLVTSQRATLRVVIRRQQQADHVYVELNGAKVGEWTGDRRLIGTTLNEGYPHDRRLSLWIQPGGNEFVFHRIRVRMLDGGTAESLRPLASVPPRPAATETD